MHQRLALPHPVLCTLWIDTPVQRAAAHPTQWATHLGAEHTVVDLMDALDRASVFLLDWRARHAEAKAPGVQPIRRYRLTRWITLHAPFNCAEFTRALALMTQTSVDREQLCSHSGLSAAQCDSLLRELSDKGVLNEQVAVAAAPQHPPAMAGALHSGASARPNPAAASLVHKLGQWLRRARLA